MKKALSTVFNPKNVAIVGASENPDKIGHTILKNFLESGFKGDIYPVNPAGGKLLGLKVYERLDELKDVDLAVLVVPAAIVPSVMRSARKIKVKAVIIITAGFREIGATGKEVQRQLTSAMKNGPLTIGPNCLGVWDGTSGVDTMFLPEYKLRRPKKGTIAIISQSGAVGSTLLDLAADLGMGVSRFISYGNADDVDETDLIEWLARDDRTKVIAAYVEGVKNGRKFMEVCKRISKKKPIIILKAGRSKKGIKAASTHTAALAGSYRVFECMCRQIGVLVVTSIDQLFDMARALAYQKPITGKRIAIVTNGGGFGVVTTDALSDQGLEIAELTQTTKNKIKKLLPSYIEVNNPVDLVGDATPSRYEKVLKVLENDPNVDGIIVITLLQTAPMDSDIVEVLSDYYLTAKKPFVACVTGGEYTKVHVLSLERDHIPNFPVPERAVTAIKALTSWKR